MVGGWAGAGPLVAANQAKETPSLQRSGLQRKQISLKEFRGKVVLLNFWATWCPYCRKESPHLVDLHSRLGGQGRQVIGAALNWKFNSRSPNDPALFMQQVSGFQLEHGLNYPVALVKKDMGKILHRFGDSVGIPYTVLIDREGRVRRTFHGVPDPDTLEKSVRTLL